MIYLIYGTEEYLIKKEINKITKNNEDITTYDLYESNIEDILFLANNLPFFDEKRIILVKNAYIFTGEKTEQINNFNNLEQYLKNPNKLTDLIFIINTDKLDTRKKITKLIKEKGNLIKIEKISDVFSYTKKEFKNYQITDSTIRLLINRVGDNINLINTYINKLKIYKINTKEITDNDIFDNTSEQINTDFFTLIENIINKNKQQSLISYQEMRKLGEEPIKIIVTLANQLRLMLQTKLLKEQYLTDNEIAVKLNVHPYRIKLANEKSYLFSINDIKTLINNLYHLDLKIKKGLIDKDMSFEQFILNL